MYREKQMLRASKFTVLSVVALLALTMSLMAACTSGQASSASASASASTASASTASASAAASSASAATSAQVKSVDSSAFVGTWDMVDMEKDGMRVSDANPGVIPQMTAENYMNIFEDGAYDLVEGEDVIQGVWRAKSATEGEMSFGVDRVPAAIVDGTLVVGPVDGVSLYFVKGESRETPPLPEGQTNLREALGY